MSLRDTSLGLQQSCYSGSAIYVAVNHVSKSTIKTNQNTKSANRVYIFLGERYIDGHTRRDNKTDMKPNCYVV